MSGQRKRCSADFKAKVALEAIRGEPSALTRIDPLLLMETDPAGAHEFVVRWPDRPVAGVVGGKFSLA